MNKNWCNGWKIQEHPRFSLVCVFVRRLSGGKIFLFRNTLVHLHKISRTDVMQPNRFNLH